MALRKLTRNFLIIAPLIILFAGGVFVKTLRRANPQVACNTQNFTGMIEYGDLTAVYDGKRLVVPQDVAYDSPSNNVLGVANPSERWVEVDLSEQKLKAWDGTTLMLETLISSGLPWWPTPKGEFRIWAKLRATRMEGGEGKYYYNLPNVPFVMFFENTTVPGWRGYGLHGTYWHNDFGKPHSHGCVNLPTNIAEKLYHWTTPVLPEGKSIVYSSEDNPGTRIIIHD